MSIFKCKMCGGTIEFNPGDTVGVCDSCGTKQTLPTTNDEIITNLHNRANTLRLKCEFDKAEEIYNKILEKNPDDAEAHWGIILCKYGIEYVEDPKTYNRVPTCHRTSFDAILADEDYKAALANGDGAQRELYEEEAKKIDRIQKDILSIVHNEKPFDVFICYKETDENGNRTQDSVIANDIYHQLTQEGFKVFYAAITLEDKVGQEYEPYIFAALNSAKVMLVVGSKPEYFTAVWVKNEWSRFLKLIKTDRSKLLIPCYRNMDAYELPEEFAHLQAQDMSKIGFINDLVRGIRKVVADTDSQEKAVRESVAVNSGNANEESLLKRAFMFLEDGDWDSANEYCEKVLDIDPENARAYLGKLMAECRACRMEDLQNCRQPFDGNGNYNKILRFAEPKLIETLKGYIAHINERNENACLTGIYDGAVNAMNSANSEGEYKAAAKIFKSIPGFKDADNLVEKCLDKAEICRKDALYNSACSNMTGNIIRNYESAIRMLESISGWKDADEQIYACQKKVEELKAKEEAERLEAERKAEEHRIAVEKAKKKAKKVFIAIASVACVCAVFLILLKTVIIPKQKYNQAMELISSGDYDSAYELLEELGKSEDIASNKYDRAIKYIDSGDYKAAYMLLDGLSYKDSAEKLLRIKPQYYKFLLKNSKVGDIVYFGTYEQDNDTSNGKEDIEWLVLAKKGNRILVISDKALDRQPYNSSRTRVTWETCTLRKWLNNDFINAAFSAEERAKIPTVTVSADKNPSYSTSPGNNTTDKVFLLSITEVNKYFSSDSAWQCRGTAYCYAQGAYKAGNGNCWWWLRSPGYTQSSAANVYDGGDVNEIGNNVFLDNNAVRPAMWISIDG
jgi:tetratricopeptide (TPR) repeat protein